MKQINWSLKRLNSLVNHFSLSCDKNKTKALAGFISPDVFLELTTDSTEMLGRISNEATELDLDELKSQTQEIYLYGELVVNDNMYTFNVINHEGRHRMVSLKNAGYHSVSIVFEFKNKIAIEFIHQLIVKGQFKGETIVKFLTPISFDYVEHGSLVDEFANSNCMMF